ncbi:MAG TPA: hypothetical protein VLA56_05090 [Pseudomonadales bacterium]|nr:hypothetical protein [Pseudomonadales bacterium]
MDWQRYRELCDEGDVLSRWLLEHTAELLRAAGDAELAARVLAITATPALERPEDHRGGPATDFFRAGLAAAEVATVVEHVQRAAAVGVRLASGRGLGGVPEAWAEYLAWLDGSHPRSPRRAQGAGTGQGRGNADGNGDGEKSP